MKPVGGSGPVALRVPNPAPRPVRHRPRHRPRARRRCRPVLRLGKFPRAYIPPLAHVHLFSKKVPKENGVILLGKSQRIKCDIFMIEMPLEISISRIKGWLKEPPPNLRPNRRGALEYSKRSDLVLKTYHSVTALGSNRAKVQKSLSPEGSRNYVPKTRTTSIKGHFFIKVR